VAIKLLDRTWRHSRAKGGDLLVLLGIADFSNDDGIAYPSVATLARKARLTPRNTQRSIRRLVGLGELVVERGCGPHGTNLYRITLADAADGRERHIVGLTYGRDDIRDLAGMTFQPLNPSEETVIKRELVRPDNMTSPTRNALPDTVRLTFDQFWSLYPARNGKKLFKGEALKKFVLLAPDDRTLLLTAVKNYAVSTLVSKGIGIKDPHRWIRTGRNDEPWRDWIEPEQMPLSQNHDNGPSRVCTKRVLAPGDRFLRECGQPAVPSGRTNEPRCLEHLVQTPTS
jgi:hypothetical protein